MTSKDQKIEWTAERIRRTFVEYFNKNNHTTVASSPLVPENDATLLFANAGMNQFKNCFTGLEKRPYQRAVSVQKVVRAGGKHNDLENVGHTARHHTFFEMLGNFSFGDYFKSEAIRFAWDFLTNVLGIDKDRLYVTVHISDDEAAKLWHEQEGVPKERIYRFDKDNFWSMGDVGPCGPCSEIFFDHAPDGKLPTAEEFEEQGDRFVEIWNLVFMQFEQDASGRKPLPKPSVDTGSGLERVAAVMQGVSNNYDTDLFTDLILSACNELGVNYQEIVEGASKGDKLSQDKLVSLRVMADHARTTAFLIADGVLPSNEGRGYVLRRIMRRAIRFGRNVSDSEKTFSLFCAAVISTMSSAFSELSERKNIITKNVDDEIERFLKTLDQGTQILNAELDKMSKSGEKIVNGEFVFRLYDTYGFPDDLTRLMAEEKGFTIDGEGFESCMQAAKEKARSSWKGQASGADELHQLEIAQKEDETQFTGYEKTSDQGKVVVVSNGKSRVNEITMGETGFIITDKTCFYAESGGQVGDRGIIEGLEAGSNFGALVIDCTKINGVFFHHIKVESGAIKVGEKVSLQVTDSERRSTANNHSATHLLHSALRSVLGEHVTQAGSLVDPIKLRFDFTHNKPLNEKEISSIEEWVNREITLSHEMQTVVTDPETAIKKEGALALFGEKYGDEVRVIKLGPSSTELCGGTHVKNTSQIRLFKVVSEAGVSSGVRRIEALTGDGAFRFLNRHLVENNQAQNFLGQKENWMQTLDHTQADPGIALKSLEKMSDEIKGLKKEIKSLKGQKIDLDQILGSAKDFSVEGEDGRFLSALVEVEDRKVLSEVTDKLKDKIKSGVVIVIGKGEESHPIIVSVSKDWSKKFPAGNFIKKVTSEMGGKGGGRPDFAQGAVVDLSKSGDGFSKAEEILGL